MPLMTNPLSSTMYTVTVEDGLPKQYRLPNLLQPTPEYGRG